MNQSITAHHLDPISPDNHSSLITSFLCNHDSRSVRIPLTIFGIIEASTTLKPLTP